MIVILVLLLTFISFSYSETETENKILNGYSKSALDEESLKLLLTTFLGNNDLENAYLVVQKGVQLYPESPYWLKMLGQISMWLNKPYEAINAFLKYYEITKDENFKKTLFNLAVNANRFDIAIKFMDVLEKNPKNVKDIVYVYINAGKIEELIKILEEMYLNYKDKEVLYNLVYVTYKYGYMDKAEKYGETLIKDYYPSLKDVLLYSDILYAKKKFRQLYEILKSVFTKIKISSDEEKSLYYQYLYNLSDLGWFLRDYEFVVKISKILIKDEKERENEYIRLSIYYLQKRDFKSASKYSFEGFKKFKNEYLASVYIESLYNLKDFKAIVDFVENEKIDYKKDIFIASKYINSLIRINNLSKALDITKSLLKEKVEPSILTELIYTSIETSNQELAKYIIDNYSEYKYNLKKPFAMLYLFLQESKEALNLFKDYNKLSFSDRNIYADILYTLGRVDESNKIRYEIFTELKNRKTLEDDELIEFLRVADEFLPEREFLENLEKNKDRIPDDVYRDIYLSHLLKRENYEYIEYLANKSSIDLKPWMKLNIALNQYNTYSQQEILEEDIEILPIRDRVSALVEIGERDKAMYYGYKGLEDNPEDYLLYKQQRDLIVSNRPKIEIKSSYLDLSNVNGIQNNLFLSYNVKNDLFFNTDINNFFLLSNKNTGIKNITNLYNFYVSIEKKLDEGSLKLGLGSLDNLSTNTYFKFLFNKYLKDKSYLTIDIGKNIPTDDTLFLKFGGMKDLYSINITHHLNNRTSVYTNPSYSIYYSSDKTKIGSSVNLYDELSYKLRVGYPDYTFRIFSSHGKYNEKEGNKGNIETLSPFADTKFLPKSFNLVGINFSFGYDNDQIYVRPWRPFMSLGLTYSDILNLGYSLEGGIGGSILRQDNLSFGFSYTKTIQQSFDKQLYLYLKYLLFY